MAAPLRVVRTPLVATPAIRAERLRLVRAPAELPHADDDLSALALELGVLDPLPLHHRVPRAQPRRADPAHAPRPAWICPEPRRLRDGAAVAPQVVMKKSTHKLALNPQTLRLLTGHALDRVAGGHPEPDANGFIMKDSIIVRTGVVATAPIDGRR